MIRTITAAIAATFLFAACSSSTDTANLDETFQKYLPWDSDSSSVETGMGGLEYIVLKEGPDGGASPVPTDMVRVHYEGRTAAGDKFDSSYDRGSPSMFRLNQVIPGWTQGLQQMTEGDVYLFYIPNALAYGNRNRGDVIKAGDDL
ncbi:FKBP-type peptidyl-prolyl cis-trans isomerase, partial [Hyphomonas sp.]